MSYYKTTGDFYALIDNGKDITTKHNEIIKASGYRHLKAHMIDGLDYYYDEKNNMVYTIGENDVIFQQPLSFDIDKFVRYNNDLPELSEHKYYFGNRNVFK